jgi:tryptophan synthase alpha subunit
MRSVKGGQILSEAVLAARAAGRTARIPFLTAGHPSKESFRTNLAELEKTGPT